MPEFFKVLAAADLPIVMPQPMLSTPLSGMRSVEDLGAETLIYLVPEAHQAIIKLIVCTSDPNDEQEITLRCYTDELGPVPLFGPVHLGPGEWAEWAGSLTLSSGARIIGAISEGLASVAVYGMERTL